VSATGEAFKEVISHDRTGCPYDFNPTKIAIAGLAGAAGELGGRAVAIGRSLNYAQATHVIFEESENVAKAAGDVISGLLNTPVAIVERATAQH
jgi:hypothetical protein